MRINVEYLISGLTACFLLISGSAVYAGCDDDREPGMDWSGCKKMHKMLDDEDFTGSRFDSTNLTFSDLSKSVFMRTSMIKADFTRAKLDGARFQKADLTKSEGYRASFVGAKFLDTRMTKTEFSRADFSRASFENIDWAKAELGRANFERVRMKEVNFEFANLARARFTDASLSGVYFTKAYTFLTRLEGVDLRRVINLTQSQLDIACGDDKTKLPDGLTRSVNWPCEE